jgi:hypothetical protein
MLTDRGDSKGRETSRLPHFLDNRLKDGGEVVSLTGRPTFTPPPHHHPTQVVFWVLISVRG